MLKFENPVDFARLQKDLVAQLAPVGTMEEWYVEQIANDCSLLERAALARDAQLSLAQRAAILRPYLSGASYDAAFRREEQIERLESQVAFLETLIDSWEKETALTDETWAELAELSVDHLFFGLEDAAPEEQHERLLFVAEQLRFELSALEGEEPPALVRALAAAGGANLHRYENEIHRRLERHLRSLERLQERRQNAK
jgi:hypothetical protein